MRIAVFISVLSMFLQAHAREIIGYYPAWQWYDRDHKSRPATLPYGKLTIINYAFFKPNADGSLSGTDSWADDNILKGEMDWNTNTYKPGTGLCDIAHAHGTKVMVSIGGWTLSDLFPAIAADAGLRQAFAAACVKAIDEFGFDGIDIDWEYPGFADHKGTDADKGNFTLLLQAIRAQLDAHGKAKGRTYLLSAALPAAPARAAALEVQKVAGLLDFLNVMTYDFFGAWDPVIGHNAPLYAQAQGDPAFCLDAAFRLYRDTYGVPAAKLNVGAAFYGRTFKGTTLYGPHQGADMSTFSADEGTPMYYNIVKAMAGGAYQRAWDAKTQVPYAVNAAGNSFISYDDPQSLAAKAGYVRSNQGRGFIIWEITGDLMDDGSTPLLDALNAGLSGSNPGNPDALAGRLAAPENTSLRVVLDPEGRLRLFRAGGTDARSWDARGRAALLPGR